MLKKYLLSLLIFFILNSYAYTAGNSGGDSDGKSIKINNFKKASSLIKQAKKYESKDKYKKAEKKFTKALKYLLLANKEKPNQPDTLNYLGFASRKIGDLELARDYAEKLKSDKFYKLCSETAQKRYEDHHSEEYFLKHMNNILK